MTQTQQARFERFRQLHARDGAFVIPNPWNAGTARILTAMGFEALATTSAGYAFSAGKRDSEAGLSRTEVLANAGEIVAATDLPVSGDLEDGFGAEPEACAETVTAALAAGLVGGSIEDTTGDARTPLHPFDAAVERVRAAAEAAKGEPFLLTARAEGFLFGSPPLSEIVRRLQAFSEAGANVLYAPGLPDLGAIRTVCAEVDKPVNVLMGLQGPRYSVEALAEAGAKRISVGGSFARAAFGAFMRAATEVRDKGTFDYAAEAAADAEIRSMMPAPGETG